MVRKLVKCSECEQLHPPKGRGTCQYVSLAKQAAINVGAPEGEWKNHLDLNLIKADGDDYMGTTGALVKELLKECRESRQFMHQQMTLMTNMMQGMAGLGMPAPGQVGQGVMAPGQVGQGVMAPGNS